MRKKEAETAEAIFLQPAEFTPGNNHVESALRTKEGILSADLDGKNGSLHILFNPALIDQDTILEAVIRAGYPVCRFSVWSIVPVVRATLTVWLS